MAATLLVNDGYSYHAADTLQNKLNAVFEDPFRSLIMKEVDQLEADVIIDGVGSGRYRRHSKALLYPQEMELRFLKPRDGMTTYNQGAFNAEHPNKIRELHTISEELLSTPALQSLVWYNFEQTQWEGYDLTFPLCIGFSIIKFFISGKADQSRSIGATPDALHQDGEVYTFAHLLERTNANGALNVIAPPEAAGNHPAAIDETNIIEQFTLENYFDSYAIFDPKVSHYVSGISRRVDGSDGSRTVLLVDFTPMKLIHQ